MPNWCSNVLSVVGPDEQIAEFVEVIQQDGEDDLFQRFFPLPDNEVENWYPWRIQNWGTKWDVPISDLYPPDDPEEYISHEPGITSIIYRFDTAWSPPVGVVERMSTQYPECIFMLMYDEPGMDFYGDVVLRNGELLREENSASVVNRYLQFTQGPDPDWMWKRFNWDNIEEEAHD